MTTLETTSWMWVENDTVVGLRLDVAQHVLRWQVDIGCHCAGDDALVQTAVAYRQEGPPAGVPAPPPDVAAEIEAALSQL